MKLVRDKQGDLQQGVNCCRSQRPHSTDYDLCHKDTESVKTQFREGGQETRYVKII